MIRIVIPEVKNIGIVAYFRNGETVCKHCAKEYGNMQGFSYARANELETDLRCSWCGFLIHGGSQSCCA